MIVAIPKPSFFAREKSTDLLFRSGFQNCHQTAIRIFYRHFSGAFAPLL